ncbi:hypothetical protein [Streptacidiphilus sp. EB129]|uniref:hypothetical protein n=1 Tax=Streptacidiphilus sp. EB129 TaxID=3156262 RepID=UPI0035122145
MAVIALCSAKSGAVTTSALALALAAPRPTLLAECDPAGGTIRSGFLQGHSTTAALGLHRLATAWRSGKLGEDFHQHIVSLDGGTGQRLLLPGLTDPAQAPALAGTWEQLVLLWPVLEGVGTDVVIDAGRVVVDSAGTLSASRSPAALLRRADVVLLVVRRSLNAAVAAAPVVATVRRDLQEHGTGADALGLLVVDEERQPSNSELSTHLGQVPVFGQLPLDRETARALTHGPSGRAISPRAELLRHARTAYEQIGAIVNRRRVQLDPSGALTSVYTGVGGNG